MRAQRGGYVSWVGLGLVLWAGKAAAQDAVAAGALFDKGVADMQAGRFDAACPAIAESQRMDPHPGTLFTLAECQAKRGKVASAVTHYQDYIGVVSRLPSEQRSRHHDRVATANAQIAKLKPSVPTLTLVLPDGAPSGTMVNRDGSEMQEAALGVPLPVDPGSHTLVTRVPGGRDHTVNVTVAVGEAKRVQLEIDKTVTTAPATTNTTARSPEPASSPQSPPEPEAQHHSHTAAYVAGGIGIAGIVLGSVTGALVFGKKGTLKDNCADHDCNTAGYDAAHSAQTLATVSTIGFGVGIAGLATSAILFLTESKSEPVARVHGWEPLLVGGANGAWAGVGRRW